MTRKTNLFEGCSWFKFNNLGLALGMAWQFFTSVLKGLKLKVRKFLGLIPTFSEVTGEKLVLGPFLPPSSYILNRINKNFCFWYIEKNVLTFISLVPSRVLWVKNVFSWVFFSRVFSESEFFSCGYFVDSKSCSGYFVSLKFFLVDILWVWVFLLWVFWLVQSLFSWIFHGFKFFFSWIFCG